MAPAHVGRRGLGEGVHEVGERPDAAIDAPFHVAVEDEVALVVGERVLHELRGRSLWRRGGWRCGRVGRRTAASTGAPIRRSVQAEERLLLRVQLDHRVEVGLRPLTGGERAEYPDTDCREHHP